MYKFNTDNILNYIHFMTPPYLGKQAFDCMFKYTEM